MDLVQIDRTRAVFQFQYVYKIQKPICPSEIWWKLYIIKQWNFIIFFNIRVHSALPIVWVENFIVTILLEISNAYVARIAQAFFFLCVKTPKRHRNRSISNDFRFYSNKHNNAQIGFWVLLHTVLIYKPVLYTYTYRLG